MQNIYDGFKEKREVAMDTDHSSENGCGSTTKTKIRFPLSDSDRAAGVAAENLWADAVEGDRYRIDNIPFYVYGVSLNDTVRAADHDGQLVFQEVVMHGGHSTYRVIFGNDSDILKPQAVALWEQLQALGCTREIAKARVFAIDVSPSTNIYDVYGILQGGEEQGIWSFEEGHCGHAV